MGPNRAEPRSSQIRLDYLLTLNLCRCAGNILTITAPVLVAIHRGHDHLFGLRTRLSTFSPSRFTFKPD